MPGLGSAEGLLNVAVCNWLQHFKNKQLSKRQRAVGGQLANRQPQG